MATYPIIEMVKTIEGEGPNTGTPVIIVRFAFGPGIKYLHLEPTDFAGPWEMWDGDAIVKQCQLLEVGNATGIVHLMGADPCFTPIDELVSKLKSAHFSVWIDTNGMIPFDGAEIDLLSVGPKPWMPFQQLLVRQAHELRLFYDNKEKKLWLDNIKRVTSCSFQNKDNQVWSVLPRRMQKDNVDAVLKFCLDNPRFTASIPLYKLYPSIDEGREKA